MKIDNITPSYNKLNSIISKIISLNYINFSEQEFVTNFYLQYNDIELFEKMLIRLTMDKQLDNTRTIIIQSLYSEIQTNINLILTNIQVLTNIDIENACWEYENQYYKEIESQTVETNKVYEELCDIENKLDGINYKEHTKTDLTQLWEKHRVISEKHKTEQEELRKLYEIHKTAEHKAIKFLDNKFSSILKLGLSFKRILLKYKPQSTKGKKIYFDMQLVLSIHEECNKKQFKDITVVGLFHNLNLLEDEEIFCIKTNEIGRTYYLIHKLSVNLEESNKQYWLKKFLSKLGINKSTYNSKYKTPVNTDSSEKSLEFGKVIDKLFDNIKKNTETNTD